jgi:hypothetical protein
MQVDPSSLPNPMTTANIPDNPSSDGCILRPDQMASFLQWQEEMARRNQEDWDREANAVDSRPSAQQRREKDFFPIPASTSQVSDNRSGHYSPPSTPAPPPDPSKSGSGKSKNNDHLETNPYRAVKAINARKIVRFTGTNHKDATTWCASVAKALSILGICRSIWHRVGMQLVDGPALTEIERVVNTDHDPATWEEFVSLLNTKFPSTLNIESIFERFKKFAFKPNERAVEAYGRFRVIQNDADIINLKYEVEAMWIKKLPPKLKELVQTQVDQSREIGVKMNIEQVVQCTYNRDARLHENRESLNSTSDNSRKHPRNNNYKKPNRPSSTKRKTNNNPTSNEDKICYNCNQRGHTFGTLSNQNCPEKPTERTLNYFKNHKKPDYSGSSKE